jgi:D-alanyl-lipoteichoic acid acyltransferase DltB (MBOAT superfamily)
MAFNSYVYLLLLIPAIAAYWLLPARFRVPYLIVASLGFYATWHAAYTPLPLVVSAVALACGRRIEAGQDKGRWLRVGIAFGLFVLAVFKYREFLFGILHLPHSWSQAARLALPLGISFYVFESISYLLDTHQGRVKNARFQDIAVFITFWPHLMAGPLVRFRELIPQLAKPARFELRNGLTGLDRLILGLVQKNLLANTLGGLIDEGFVPTAALTNSTVDNWFLAIGFGLQIYFDFASYSNMAIGAAQLLGIKLPENFRHPYHAGTPPEFWTRWHMTLSRWIRDYLFFPINAKYAGARLPLYASLIGIMGLVGLWHGAGWGFIAWGVLHGVYLVLFRIWESFVADRPGLKASALARLAWRVFTLVAVTAAWVPFRAATLGQAARMLGSMFGRPHLDVSYSVNSYLVVALIAGYAAIEPWLSARWDALLAKSEAANRDLWMRYALRPVLYAIGLFLFLIFDDQDRAFIYFQF